MTNSLFRAIQLNNGILKWYKIYLLNDIIIRKYDNIESLKRQYPEAQEIKEN